MSQFSGDSSRGAFSFGPGSRIKKRADFLRIQGGGKKSRTEHFLLIACPNDGPRARLGVTITKKIDKRAVRRNFVKRRVREFFRKNQGRIGRSSDIVVVALRGANELSGLEITRELDKLFARSRVLKFAKQEQKQVG